MSVALLDVNFLLALAWPNHVHHGLAREWFKNHQSEGWATSPITQLGFVRISSNPAFSKDAVSFVEAHSQMTAMMSRPNHHFWQDDLSCSNERFSELHIMGHRQVTDAYLLTLAIHHEGRLVTLDQGISNLLPHQSPWAQHLCIVRDV